MHLSPLPPDKSLKYLRRGTSGGQKSVANSECDTMPYASTLVSINVPLITLLVHQYGQRDELDSAGAREGTREAIFDELKGWQPIRVFFFRIHILAGFFSEFRHF